MQYRVSVGTQEDKVVECGLRGIRSLTNRFNMVSDDVAIAKLPACLTEMKVAHLGAKLRIGFLCCN